MASKIVQISTSECNRDIVCYCLHEDGTLSLRYHTTGEWETIALPAPLAPIEPAPAPPPIDLEYLGDGVYAYFDGYHTWLRTERDGRVHEIALEPAMAAQVLEYDRRQRSAAVAPMRAQARPPAPPSPEDDGIPF